LLSDPDQASGAACLALVTIGNQPAGCRRDALLNGDGDLRCAAAEALANHTDEGHPILQEGSRMEDPGVRRATIYGLQRIDESWAVETLHKLQKDDEQWVVKNAAGQALEEISHPDLSIPQPNPPLSHTPWLIAFAGERGLGVAPGKPAVDLLLLAMLEGNEDQRLAAMDLACRLAENRAGSIAVEILAQNSGELREMAFTTLWRLTAAGAASPMETVIRSA
jgi:HEAT repeat protein